MNRKQKTKTIFKRAISTLAIFLAFFVFSSPFVVMAAEDETTGVGQAVTGLKEAATAMHGEDPDADGSTVIQNVPQTIGRMVGAVLAFVGTLFLILTIYSGFTWMLARGNESEVQKAKDMLESAVIGLIIVLAAYAITAYIGTSLT